MKKTLILYNIIILQLLYHSANASSNAENTEFNRVLSQYASTIKTANQIKVARLKLIDAVTAQKNTLKYNTSIAGYPVDKHLSVLTSDDRTLILKILLNSKNYSPRLIRCKNGYFIGFRFSDQATDKAPDKIEFALGIPCNQAIWAIPSEIENILLGSVLEKNSAHQITEIFNKYKTQK